jgi:hypothetical protein
MVRTWPEDELRALPLEAFDERYRRYRLSVPEAERAMAGSLRRYGQMSPVVVCEREERAVLVDGFKRLAAARSLRGLGTLLARRVELDERSAKAAVYALNCVGRQPQELEEAWIVQALVREDGLSQVEVGGVPATCLYDCMKVVVSRHEDDQPIYHPRFLAFATHYGYRPVACRPRVVKKRDGFAY